MLSAMLCSIAGSVYDVLGYVHWYMTVPHDGMPFSTLDVDNDTMSTINCAWYLGGGWWFAGCSLWTANTASPVWYSLGDDSWYSMEKCRMMVKLH